MTEYEHFREMTMADAGLMQRFLHCGSEAALIAEVLKIGGERGFRLEKRELVETIRLNRQLWLERWIYQ